VVKANIKALLIFLGFSLLIILRGQAQTSGTGNIMDVTPTDSPKVFVFVEQQPEFPGGDKALIQFLQQNIRYPDYERILAIEGKVFLKFVVMEDGSVNDVRVVRGTSKGLDEEALRVVKKLPNFKPGKQQGKLVRVYFNLPVVYKLSGDDNFTPAVNAFAEQHKDFNTGLTAMRSRDFATAIKYFSKAAEKYKNGNIYNLLWVCYKETGDTINMCQALNKAIKLGHPEEQSTLERYCM
jgi:TonB family protein